jgi:hypothetical protein
MLKARLLDVAWEIAVSLGNNGILIDHKLLLTGSTLNSPALQFLVDRKLSLTGWTLDAESHRERLPAGNGDRFLITEPGFNTIRSNFPSLKRGIPARARLTLDPPI